MCDMFSQGNSRERRHIYTHIHRETTSLGDKVLCVLLFASLLLIRWAWTRLAVPLPYEPTCLLRPEFLALLSSFSFFFFLSLFLSSSFPSFVYRFISFFSLILSLRTTSILLLPFLHLLTWIRAHHSMAFALRRRDELVITHRAVPGHVTGDVSGGIASILFSLFAGLV